jgi:recombination protein RecT
MTTEIAKKSDVRSLIESDAFKAQIQKALPKHLTPDRFIRVAVTAMTRTPKLAECTQASLFNALLTCSQLGIEPDGRRAHLIPYGKDCQLIIDYKGLAELAMRSGVVANIHADVVCDADTFEYDRGSVRTHTIDFRKPRGKVYAVYAICRFKDGTEKAEVLSAEEVEAVRKRSRAGQAGPWVTDWNEMAKKTAFRRLSKWLPLSPEYRDALDHDADAIDITGSVKTEPKAMREAVEITLDDLDMGDAKGGDDESK